MNAKGEDRGREKKDSVIQSVIVPAIASQLVMEKYRSCPAGA